MKLHALLGYPVWKLCELVKNSSASFLCIQEAYIISTISQFESDSKMCTFEVHLCMMSGQLILSGRPFNTFSMARLKILQLRLTLTPLFTATHAFLISLSPFFFMICDWGSPSFLYRPTAEESRTMIGVFCLFSWPSIYVSYWFTVICEILKNGKFLFPWIVIWIFFYFLRFVTRNTSPPFLMFWSMEKVFKIDLNLQKKNSSIFICIFKEVFASRASLLIVIIIM